MSDVHVVAAERRHALTLRVAEVLERHVRPELAADGGAVELVGVDADDVAQVRLLGSCQGCASTTYQWVMMIEAIVKSHVPEVRFIEAVL